LKHDNPTASILEFLRIEKKCYDDVLNLMKEQIHAIEQGDEQRLDAIIEKKNGILKIAGANETSLEQAMAEIPNDQLAEVGTQAETLRMEVVFVLTQIIETENNCQAELKARKFLAQDKILDLKQSRNLLKGYGNSQGVKPKISKNV
jgi:recombinational DNA repair ATPase RecF